MQRLLGAPVMIVAATGTDLAEPPTSGLRSGGEVSAREPIHLAGPQADTRTCPVRTHLEAPVQLAFEKDVVAAEILAKPLEEIAKSYAKGELKVLLVVVDGSDGQLLRFAKDHSIIHVMLCRPDPELRVKQLKAYEIDPSASSTVMLYQDDTVKKSWTALTAPDLTRSKAATDP
jgi:hypothetical protein